MADHLDAPGLVSPGGDARVDITDIYAFQKPGDPDKSILILDVNPLAPTLATEFRPRANYQINIDTDGDALTEIAFNIVFFEREDGRQRAHVRLATGNHASRPAPSGRVIVPDALVSFGSTPLVTTRGPYKFFAGFRSDPFFFDLMGFLNGFQFTGTDFFLDKNVFGIVLEVPNQALGPNPHIGVWARTTIHQHGRWVQVDRMGRPAINTVFNHDEDKNVFNSIVPSEDRSRFEASFVSTLESFGYSMAQATTIAEILLPDILTYDYSSSAGFLNGRKLTDDVIDIELNLVTDGQVATDMVGPHTDYLAHFPYLGAPHQ